MNTEQDRTDPAAAADDADDTAGLPQQMLTQGRHFEAQARELVEARPLVALGVALALGYTLGMFWSRR